MISTWCIPSSRSQTFRICWFWDCRSHTHTTGNKKEGRQCTEGKFIYSYLVSDTWYRITHVVRENLLPPPHGLLFPISSKGSCIYAPSHLQDSTHHSLFYTNCGALDGTRNSSMGPPWGINLITHHTMSRCSTMKQCQLEKHLVASLIPGYCSPAQISC